MGIYDALFNMIFNLLSIYIDIRIIKLFLPAREVEKALARSLCLGVWVINWLVYYCFKIPDLTTISHFVGLLFIAGILFLGNIWQTLFSVIISSGTQIISENIVWKIFSGVPLLAKSNAVGAFCSVVLVFGGVLCAERFILLKQYKNVPREIYANIAIIAIGSVILSEIVTLQADSESAALIAMSIICLINLSTYYIYEKIAESWEEKIRNAEMEQQLRMYINQFDMIEKSQQNIRSIRHDMKNHIFLIGSYLHNQEYEKAEEYIFKLGEELKSGKEYVRTGNVEIDSILNYKLEYGEKKAGSKIKIQVEVPEQMFMPAFDLNVLLSNLLDNAIEAVQKIDDR